jgi:hypothetical protein
MEQTIYVGTGWGVIKSEDGGTTWKHASEGLAGESGDFPWVHKVLIDLDNPETVYALTRRTMYHSPQPVFKRLSQNTDTSQGPPDRYYKSVNVVAGIYRTQNGGASWERVVSNIDFSSLAPADIAIHPEDSQILYVGTIQGVYRTLNRGESFERILDTLPTAPWIISIAIDPVEPAIIYVGSIFDGAYRSMDSGVTWEQIFIHPPKIFGTIVYSVLIDPTNHNRIYIQYRRQLCVIIIAQSSYVGRNELNYIGSGFS